MKTDPYSSIQDAEKISLIRKPQNYINKVINAIICFNRTQKKEQLQGCPLNSISKVKLAL
jgi:hypothetical protein